MSITFRAKALKACEALLKQISLLGFSIQHGSDFRAFAGLHALVRPTEMLSAALDPTIGEVAGSWTAIRDAENKPVGIQAFRDLGSVKPNLEDRISSQLPLFAPPDVRVDPGRSRLHTSILGQRAGRTAYHGEGYLAPSARRLGLARLFFRLGLLRAALEYEPETLFGILVPANDSQAYAEMAGYINHEPGAFIWRDRFGATQAVEGLGVTDMPGIEILAESPLAASWWPSPSS